MNNPEFEPDILDTKDRSGYSEKQTDLLIDKKGTGGQGVKQFNRQTKSKGDDNTIVTLKKQKRAEVIFER